MIAQRRKMCEYYTRVGRNVWSYRFDTPLWNASVPVLDPHFVPEYQRSTRATAVALGL